MIDLTMDEVSDGETAPETPAVDRRPGGIVKTPRAEYESKKSKDTKRPRKLIQTENRFHDRFENSSENRLENRLGNRLENRLENRHENRLERGKNIFENESESAGPSRPRHSKSMKLWNGESDKKEREKYYREKSEREKHERENELRTGNIERKTREEERIRYESRHREQQRLNQRMTALTQNRQNPANARSLQEENSEFRRILVPQMVGLRHSDPQNPSLFVKTENPTQFSGELDENNEQLPDFSGGARNPFEVNYGYKWFENTDGTKTLSRKCVKRVLEPVKDRKEIDILAMERLDEDNAHILRKVDTLMDNLTRPLEDAMAMYGELNDKYIRGQEGGKLMTWMDFEMLVILEKTITADMFELEKEICSKF
jgi:hypothetical protein